MESVRNFSVFENTTFYEPRYKDSSMVVSCFILAIIIEIFGNDFFAALLLYEKYSIQESKQTIINKLATSLCICGIIQNLLSCPLLTYKLTIQTLGKISLNPSKSEIEMYFTDHYGALIATYTIVGCMIYSSLILAEITVLKCLYIKNWSKMAMAEDNFWSKILIIVNSIISGSCVFIRLYLGEANTNFHYFRLRNSHLIEYNLQPHVIHRNINTW